MNYKHNKMKTLRKTIAIAILGSVILGTTSLQAGQNVNLVNKAESRTEKAQFCFYYSCVSYETKTDCQGCTVTYKVTRWYYFGCLVSTCREVVSKNCNIPTEQ